MAPRVDLSALRSIAEDQAAGACVHIDGVVQGVGFRPFIYSLAKRYDLTGWVRNTSAGVDIEVDGPAASLREFVGAITRQAPPLARIDSVKFQVTDPNGYAEFEIVHSEDVSGAFQPVSPDVSLCDDCRRELKDPADRRYRYPFINCTNCGPRFTIIRNLPYDRPLTTMAGFELCPDCRQEYEDPSDRRFHAQPVACPKCGPHLWLELGGQVRHRRDAALQAARQLLLQGRIVAIKGLGGFHLACDASNEGAVARLRSRKGRQAKPFALMVHSLEAAEEFCKLTKSEQKLLLSRERPIVLLQRILGSRLASEVAPGQHSLGMMLPYTPLHELLLEPEPGFPTALIMTSGNRSEEPIAHTVEGAREQLADIADAFLLHNRPIESRCDDSVIRTFRETIYPLRRARGYAPYPVALHSSVPSVLGVGGELKNTFCLTRDRSAFVSHHIGDLQNFETLQSFESAIEHYEELFRSEPEVLAYDLHPDYLATRYALERAQLEGLPTIGVQHHHAHIASCLAENGVPGTEPVIGLSFDGTGYGPDGAIWGGEVLVASLSGYRRVYHLPYVPLPGGEAAVKEPWRMALVWLREAGVDWSTDLPPVAFASQQARSIVERQLQIGLNAPPTSSMGRLFDAVSSLIGIRHRVTYEAQAAMEMETLVSEAVPDAYPFEMADGELDPRPAIRGIVEDLERGVSSSILATRFHNGLADLALQVCLAIRGEEKLTTVALSGGVWQNMALLRRTVTRLEEAGFDVLHHRQVPTNDGGLSLGQAAVAGHLMQIDPSATDQDQRAATRRT